MKIPHEKEWTTQVGFRAIVLMVEDRHRCGYVEIPEGHPLHGAAYDAPNGSIIPPGENEPIGKRGSIPLFFISGLDSLTSPQVAFDVHGSVTFAGTMDGGKGWWFGFDCAHSGDCNSPEYYARMEKEYPNSPLMWRGSFAGEFRSLEYCVSECESLAKQIIDRTRM